MITKHFYLFTFLVFSHFSNGQDAPAPKYLTQQAFPDSALMVTLTTLSEEKITFDAILKKYEGKKILIDFWASWCRDCLAGLPEVKKLQKKINKENVVFVFLSLDKDAIKWKKGITSFEIEGEHYWLDIGWKNALTNYIQLDWIPRYIVLDEKGKIILAKTVHANDSELKKALTTK